MRAGVPAKIILVTSPQTDEKNLAMLASAARYFRDRLFVAPAGEEGRNLDDVLPQQARDVPNLLFVAGVDADGRLAANANFGAATVDLATDGAIRDHPDTASVNDKAPVSSSRAAARAAALAARVLAVEPFIAGAALKARITGLAIHAASAGSDRTRHGFIERPWRHFWLE